MSMRTLNCAWLKWGASAAAAALEWCSPCILPLLPYCLPHFGPADVPRPLLPTSLQPQPWEPNYPFEEAIGGPLEKAIQTCRVLQESPESLTAAWPFRPSLHHHLSYILKRS